MGHPKPQPEAPEREHTTTRTWVVTPIYISDEESVERAAKLAREYGEYLATLNKD